MNHETLSLSPGSAASVTTHRLAASVNLLTFGAELEPGMTTAEIVRACQPTQIKPTTVEQIIGALIASPIGTWTVIDGDVPGAITRAEGVYQDWREAFHDHPHLTVVMEATQQDVTVRLEPTMAYRIERTEASRQRIELAMMRKLELRRSRDAEKV